VVPSRKALLKLERTCTKHIIISTLPSFAMFW
jgi:hypothetical protein